MLWRWYPLSVYFLTRDNFLGLVAGMSYVCFTAVGRECRRIIRLTSSEPSSVTQTVTDNGYHLKIESKVFSLRCRIRPIVFDGGSVDLYVEL